MYFLVNSKESYLQQPGFDIPEEVLRLLWSSFHTVAESSDFSESTFQPDIAVLCTET